MSGGTFHVHGPHDHELEHAQQHAGEATASRRSTASAAAA
jgi:hypothetical protein